MYTYTKHKIHEETLAATTADSLWRASLAHECVHEECIEHRIAHDVMNMHALHLWGDGSC
jgi:hypothetical protein